MLKMKKTGCFIMALSMIVSLFAGTVAPPGLKTVKAQTDDNEPQYEERQDEKGNTYQVCTDTGNSHARYTGNGWWAKDGDKDLVPVSPSRSVANGETVYYSIVAENDVSLCVELAKKQDSTYSNHLTTSAGNDAWFADAEKDPTPPVIEDKENNVANSCGCLESGHVYEIAITRQDDGDKSNYTIIYKDVSSNLPYMKVTAASAGTTGDDVIVHVLAQEGTFRLYDGKESDFHLWKGSTNHGRKVRNRLISRSELENNAPEDYTIPTGLIQEAKDGDYPDYFLKDDVQTVNITMPDKNLDYILQHAVGKPSAMTTSVKIGNSPEIGYASLKTKGNYTLRHTANNTQSDRFSFTINFGKYIKKNWGQNNNAKKQNFYGCHKISFNNCLNDKTFLKEYNAMRLMDEMGLPTPEYGIAKLSINGEYYGVYFMVEAMDGTIIERHKNFDSKGVSDYIAKPDYTKLSYDFDNSCVEQCVENGVITMDALREKGLLWKEENGDYNAAGVMWEQFGALWENDHDTLQDVAKEIPAVLTWNRKLQRLSNGQNFNGTKIDTNSSAYLSLLEEIVDVNEVVKYFASLSFIISMDNMVTWGQNYGLYIDKDGKAILVPWDHDLGWGGYFNPDTTEAVANWDIDQLYPGDFYDMGIGELQDRNMTRAQIYSLVPLFHVIYQNSSLMKKYHAYMDDCTKIVSMGGTTSNKKTYEPGRFSKTIDALYPSITKAAGESMGENIYYVWNPSQDNPTDHVEQPACAKEGIPMLKKLIAMRSAGVWLQTHDKKANVTAYGCDLAKIGGAFTGELSTEGTLTAVNAETGIFATATYGSGNGGPLLTVNKLTSGSLYNTIKAKAGTDVTVYQMKNEKQPNSGYTLYLPAVPKDGKCNVYSYSESGGLAKLAATAYDNIYCVSTSGISCIVLAKEKTQNGGASTVKPNNGSTTTDENKKPVNTTKKKKKATITVKKGKKKISTVTVKKRKKITLKVSVNSKGKLSLSKLTKKQKKIASVKLSGKKITIKGKKKGSFSFKLNVAAKGAYKKGTKKIKIKVK